MVEQPNIVLIMADQLTTKALSAYGSLGAVTPNIDRLANRGVVFSNSYCSSPLCAPSRASLVTGLRPSKIGVYDNGSEFPASTPTVMHHLRRAGYQTVLSGKMHFVGPDQLHGLNRRLTTDIFPAHFNWTPDWRRGIYANSGTSVKTLQLSGSCLSNIQTMYDSETHFRALEFLNYQALEPDGKPFFLTISYTNPHEPFMIPERFLGRITDSRIDYPSTPNIDFDDHHSYNQWIQVHHEVDKYPPTAEVIAKSRQAYFGMVSYVDSLVGEIMDQLERLRLMENTILIFTSDHGEMLGEHGMWFKRTFYEDSIKVPLIISWPGVWAGGKSVSEVVSLMDLFPTLLEIGEVPNCAEISGKVDGDSLVGLLSGYDSKWRNSAVVEYLGEGIIEPMIALRWDTQKYVAVNGHKSILFNLADDPQELCGEEGRDLPPSSPDELRTLLDSWDGEQIKKMVMHSQQERLMIAEATKDGQGVAWDYSPEYDASAQYIRVLNLPKFV